MVQNGSTMSTPTYDLVAFGATSFVGKILCRYLWEEFGAQGAMKWGAAGRSKAKLEELRSSLGATAGTLPLLVADAADETSFEKQETKIKKAIQVKTRKVKQNEVMIKNIKS